MQSSLRQSSLSYWHKIKGFRGRQNICEVMPLSNILFSIKVLLKPTSSRKSSNAKATTIVFQCSGAIGLRKTSIISFYKNVKKRNRPVGSGVRHCYRCRRSGVRFPGRSNRTHCRQHIATSAMFLPSCVTQALNCEDGPCHLGALQRI